MASASVTGWNIDGRYLCENSRLSMSINQSPKTSSWSSRISVSYEGDLPEDNLDLLEELQLIREDWLSQFNLQISQSSENGFRYWRWIDEDGKIRWWERRPWVKAEPKILGFWPN